MSGCNGWLQPGAGPGHTRFNPDENRLTPANVGSLSPSWSVEVPEGLSEPIVSGNRVYVTHLDVGPSSSVGARAYDLASGSLSWDATLASGLGSPDATPVAFSGNELWLAHRNAAAGFDLARLDPASGDVVGSEPIGTTSWPFVTAEGRVAHVYTDDSQDVTLTLAVRDRASSATLWTHDFPPPVAPPPGGEITFSTPTPTMADGKVYVVVGSTLHAFAAAGCGASQCAPLWTSPLLGWNQPPVAADGRVFVVSSRSYEYRGGRYATGQLDVYDGAEGSLLWSETYRGANVVSNGGISDVAVAGDSVYVSGYRDLPPNGREHTLTAYAAGGCEGNPCPLWTAPAPGGALAVGGGVVYVGDRVSDTSAVRAFAADGCAAATCDPLATVPVPGQLSYVTVAHGRLVVGSALADGRSRLTAFAAH